MSKIKILVIPPDVHGVGKFRMIGPYTFLQDNYGDDFHIDIKFEVPNKDEEFDGYDIVVFHSFIHKKVELTLDLSNDEKREKAFIENLNRINWLKNKGVIVIIDSDDLWEPDPKIPSYLNILRDGINKKKIEFIKASSYVTVTTPFFRDTMMKRLGVKNVLVFPNAIDETESQFIPNPTKSDKIRFGWVGGSSHLYDLELMKSGVANTYLSYHDKVQFVLCGFDLRGKMTLHNKDTGEKTIRDMKPEETASYNYERIFTNDYKWLDKSYIKFLKTFKDEYYYDENESYRRRWTTEASKYAFNYNLFDISLAPLIDNIFNNNKSQLKVIEAGFHKKALIASECEPYTFDLVNAIDFGGSFNPKGNALLVSHRKNHKQWGQHMKKLIDNPNLVEDLSNKLYETVYPNYSMKNVCKTRREFLKSIINK